jgi:ribosomal protein S18 acetylase RimI-like enzyme
MIQIELLQTVTIAELRPLIQGYVSHEKYVVSWQAAEERISFALELTPLETPYRQRFELEPAEHYERICDTGFSLAAYEGSSRVAIALCEPHFWNQSLQIHEFHVLPARQGQGIGRELMEAVARQARAAGLRILSAESQNTNIPAIRFYRKLGFRLEGLDLSYYTNQDWPNGEIALWMKRKMS